MRKAQHPTHHLDLRIRELGQLFNSMDPTPFLNKDLDRDAEAFIETWAQGFVSNSHLHITIHLEEPYLDGNATDLITDALHNFFNYKAALVRGELKRLLADGRTSLFIGLIFLTLCLFAAEWIGAASSGTSLRIAREGLTIIGWVALWRPLQIFLYDWWPLARRRRVYKSLSQAQIKVLAAQ